MKPLTWRKTSIPLFFAVFTVFSLFICLFFCSGNVQAKAKPALSRKTMKITVGKKKTLKVLHASKKVKWSTSNKKIAKIVKKSGKKNQKVVIKAKKAGKCYVKAKIGKKTLKCKIIVKKKAPVKEPIQAEEPAERKIEEKELSGTSRDLTANLTAVIPEAKAPTAEFIKGFAGFSFDLLKKTIQADRANGKNDNVLISPDSVTTALAMTENGAAGQTLSEMEDTLCPGVGVEDYNNYLSGINRRLMASDALIYNVSNSIWAQEDTMEGLVREDFLQTNKNYHDAEFYLAPFNEQTIDDMNNWVYNKSRNMIDKIIDQLSKDARMVLINTVAFEGQWLEPFHKSQEKETFTAYDKTKQKVTMLRDTESYEYLELKGGKGFVKYYGKNTFKEMKKGQVAFVALLPPDGMDADTYIQSLDGASFINSWNNKKMKRVAITLPEFQTDYGVEMGTPLQEMGIVTAFTDDADFTRMADPSAETPGLKISKVLHKTHIELDENGTKAAAATAVVMEKATAIFGDDPIQLTFNRPFVYALVDTQTGLPLFIGEVRTLSK